MVKVDNTRKREAIPTVNTDWWNYGGITRSVHLVSVPEKHIDDYVVRLSTDGKDKAEGWVKLAGSSKNDEVTISIPELEKSEKVKVAENGFADFSFNATPELWFPSNPNYTP